MLPAHDVEMVPVFDDRARVVGPELAVEHSPTLSDTSAMPPDCHL